jgi:PIN domain nuclease of toxin-antitoxin system
MTGTRRGSSIEATVWRPAMLPTYDGPLLLDTHIWVWYLEGDLTHLTPAVVPLLERSGTAQRLHVSDISYWEVAVKSAKAKLTFSVDATVWLHRAEKAPGIQFLALDRDILLLSTRLPGTAHNDPADRMLIAIAQLHNIPLVTADRLIVDYATTHPGTPVVDARP